MTDLAATAVWALILGMALINFTERFVPLALVSRLQLPRPVLRWLSYVPISVMGSLVASEVITPGGRYTPPLSSPWFYAAVLTALMYRYTRSFLGATLAGMAGFVALRALLS